MKAVCSSADRLVLTEGGAKYSLHDSKSVCWFHSGEGCAKYSITILSLSEVSNIRRKSKGKNRVVQEL